MVNENSNNSALRIIDASFNRAMEGLRVVEEFTRMHLNDGTMSSELKDLRHQLANYVDSFFDNQLLTRRDILHDVGTGVQTVSEYQRSDMQQIVRANFARALQSLRSIEEYSKLVAPDSSRSFEKLRYRCYELEKAIVNSSMSQAILRDAQIYVLTDTRNSFQQFESLAGELIDAKVDLIQLRDKRLSDRELIRAGRLLAKLTRSTSTRWIMNDRADLAVLCEADGVHVGQDDLDVPSARRIVGAGKLIGVSTHNLAQAKDAVLNGANYIGVGPMFESETKSFDGFASLEFLNSAIEQISLPAFAIGGINETNIQKLVDAGATRIAVSNSVVAHSHPSKQVARFRRCLNKASVPSQ